MYMPALRPDLAETGNGLKFPNLRTVVFCTEDSVGARHLSIALANIKRVLSQLEPVRVFRFIRPRNPEVLRTILEFPHIDKINGFIIPKADRKTLPAYFEALADYGDFEIMPIIETTLAFDLPELFRLRDFLAESPLRPRITALRIGSMDLMSILSLRRNISRSVYETPIGHTIDQLITVFKPMGLDLTAPCFEGVEQNETLAAELFLDVSRGLFSKTAIHPSQIEIIEYSYQVAVEELEMAEAILDPTSPPIFRLGARMCEKTAHSNWAATVLERARLFGVRGAKPELDLSQEWEKIANADYYPCG